MAAIIESGKSTKDYYKVINRLFLKAFNKSMMLHYPFFQAADESFQKRQENLVEFCINKALSVKNKQILDVGCGNGSQTSYIAAIAEPETILGVDFNVANIDNAGEHFSTETITFRIDDAQNLATIENSSVDLVICIESAFHYPNKAAFLKSVHRVLKPGGQLIIADILTKSYRKGPFLRNWKKKMSYNHWTKKDYLASFKNTALEVETSENITPSIIKGYSGYTSWFGKNDTILWHELFATKIFMHFQVVLNVLLLKRRRDYYLFVCRKNGE